MNDTNKSLLLTWLDVERVLKVKTELWKKLPSGVLAIDCFVDGVDIRHQTTEESVFKWLESIFPRVFDTNSKSIKLSIGEALYPVQLRYENGDVEVGQTYPLWRDLTYLDSSSAAADQKATNDSPPAFGIDGPSLVSFHSFKGGVGRTTSLMTYVAACFQCNSKRPKKILVVDADLEAPGVSFWLGDENRPQVSFLQLLEALHYPPTNIKDTLNFFVGELRKTSMDVGGVQSELFVLPAALNLREIEDMPITPEHLARNPDNRWQLSDNLYELGRLLGVDVVFIDLRAGLSELASPILFDPRIDHFFVSTVAPQSVQGIAEVLQRLYVSNNRWKSSDPKPTVILSLLTNELKRSSYYEYALKCLSEAYPLDPTQQDGLADPEGAIQWREADFLNPLMAIGSVKEALDLLPSSVSLFKSALEWAESHYGGREELSNQNADNALSEMSRQEKTKKLKEICEAAEFADHNAVPQMLAIEPLRNLGKHYEKELPSVLMIGAKGAGKTFTYRHMILQGTWKKFIQALGFDGGGALDAFIFPVLCSKDQPTQEITELKRKVLDGNEHAYLLNYEDINKRVALITRNPPDYWPDFWDNLIAESLGVAKGDRSLDRLNQEQKNKNQKIVLVFDGIENLFPDMADSESKKAVEALISLPNRINGLLGERFLGAVVCVREDYVKSCVLQNFGQLMQRFSPFRLQWNTESFLRLAFMLASQADIFEQKEDPSTLNVEDLKERLVSLWGKKLGSEKSKEAHSARWVYSALCDLMGHLQARDLVRFLKLSANLEFSRTTTSPWSDRVLSPPSMKNAIPQCSVEKVDEAAAEIEPLRRWRRVLDEKGVKGLSVPFSQKAAALDSQLLQDLIDIGVIYKDTDSKLGEECLFIPEIYRNGLGFVLSNAGRPRIQALLKKNLGSIPL